jgi:hypothetical protein
MGLLLSFIYLFIYEVGTDRKPLFINYNAFICFFFIIGQFGGPYLYITMWEGKRLLSIMW